MRTYTLIGADGAPRPSAAPGTLGGHRRTKVYGRLDCAGALRWIEKGHYVGHRVFFADEATALAAGFRPCARCLPGRYAAWKAGRMVVRVADFDATAVLAFLAARAIPGVEHADATSYRRDGFALSAAGDGVELDAEGDVIDLVRRTRRMLDVDAPSEALARFGLRAPGAFDEYETGVRAIVGQGISVAATRTILGRLPARESLAAADPAGLPMPRVRARALIAYASGEPLEEIKGVGRWTRDYVRMRMGDRDVLLSGDLVVRRALGMTAREIDRHGERWRPYRSYATHRLWAGPAGSATMAPCTATPRRPSVPRSA